MLFYLPLESYKERYTCLLSSKGGWIESKLMDLCIPFQRIEGKSIGTEGIITGQVLDAHARSYWSLTQIAEVVRLLQTKAIKDGDTLYLDDFWTPGLEAIPYICDQLGIKLKIYAMLHAQSVDKYDFVAKMKDWLRHYEVGQSRYMCGIFVTSEYLQDLCVEAGMANVFLTGLPYNRKWVENNFPTEDIIKENTVIYTSRFDSEKNPLLFVQAAKRFKGRFKFLMTTSAHDIRSNDSEIISALLNAERDGIIEIKRGLTKHQYYTELAKAKYIVNTALQDWVSWTLIEGIHHGCIPIYPKYRSFPEVLNSNYLYIKGDVDSLCETIESNVTFDSRLLLIPKHFDESFLRCLKIMGLV